MRKMLLVLVGIALFLFILLHLLWYIQPSEIKTMQQLDARLMDGHPTVVEFYSNL